MSTDFDIFEDDLDQLTISSHLNGLNAVDNSVTAFEKELFVDPEMIPMKSYEGRKALIPGMYSKVQFSQQCIDSILPC
jgi:hypothetical protein